MIKSCTGCEKPLAENEPYVAYSTVAPAPSWGAWSGGRRRSPTITRWVTDSRYHLRCDPGVASR
jgi:hypothetical protein